MTFARTLRSCFAWIFGATLIGVVLSACSGGNGVQSLPSSQQSQNATTTNTNQQTPNATTATFSQFRYHLYPVHERGPAVRAQAVNYPADLQFYGGRVVTSAISHDIYVNCAASCWGNPQEFLDNLNDSTFIHVVDQYVHTTANYRYRFGSNYAATVKFTTSNMISANQIINLVHAAALRFGGGYTNIYHVFLPEGIDTCMEGTTTCYSPDNPANWAFCAYHSSVDFSDKSGHVLFTVMPYQDVFGCATTGGPNPELVDSTDSTLTHEYIETITDPDPDGAWFNMNFDDEAADLCASYQDTDLIYSHKYEIQEIYSNRIHGCTNNG